MSSTPSPQNDPADHHCVANPVANAPAIRTRCLLHDSSSDSTTTLKFPVLPEYQLSGNDKFIVPVTIVKPSSILTEWLPTLEGTTTTSSGNQTSDYLSGVLTIQIPHYNSTTEFAAFACSVDARWALGNNIATNVLDYSYSSDSLQHDEVLSSVPFAPGNRFLPVPDGTWSKISMDLDLLNALIPLLNSSSKAEARNMPDYTSYASMLSDAGMDNGTSLVVSWGDIRSSLEITLAVLVAEGLARIGFSANGGSMKYESDSSSILNIPKTTNSNFTNDALNSLLMDDGNAVLLPKGVGPENLTKVHWGITIAGYAYKADSIGYYLAIAVLFAHIVLAFLHFVYSFFYVGLSSDAWGSFEDLMVLSHSS